MPHSGLTGNRHHWHLRVCPLDTASLHYNLHTMLSFAQPPDHSHSYESTSAPIEQSVVTCPRKMGPITDLNQFSRFNPYSDNGGTILAIAGSDFSVIAGDTRQSEGYSIQTRYARKVFQL